MIHLKRYYILASLTYILFSLQACGDAPVVNPQSTQLSDSVKLALADNQVILSESQYKAAGITYGVPALKELSSSFQVSGLLGVPPQNAVSVTTVFGGTVQSTTLLEGEKVQKGKSLVTLENPEFVQLQQEYLDNNSQLIYLKTEYDRQQKLSEANINAKKTLQKARADYNSMLTRVNGLKAKLAMLSISTSTLEREGIRNSVTIYSPISGYVTKVNVNRGSYVTPNNELFRIVNTENMYVELSVFEKDIAKIAIGQKVYFSMTGSEALSEATVSLIGKEIREDRSISVICHIDKRANNNFIPGMYVKARIETKMSETAALPEEAIVDFQGKQFIFLSDKNKGQVFRMEEVKTGSTANGFTAVTLPADLDTARSQIVLTGAYNLLSQLKNSAEE